MTTDQYDFIITGGGACVNVGYVPIPYAKELEQAALPQPQQIADVVKVLMESSLPQAGRPVL